MSLPRKEGSYLFAKFANHGEVATAAIAGAGRAVFPDTVPRAEKVPLPYAITRIPPWREPARSFATRLRAAASPWEETDSPESRRKATYASASRIPTA